MKVSDFRPEVTSPDEARLDRPEKGSARSQDARQETSPDKVSLSAVSETLLQKVDNNAKVEALKSAYEAGAYKVNAEELAKSILKADFAASQPDKSSRSPKS